MSTKGLNKTKAAEHAGVSRQTFGRWVKAGHAPDHPNGRWTPEEVDEAVRNLPRHGERGIGKNAKNLAKKGEQAKAAEPETATPSPAPPSEPIQPKAKKAGEGLNLPKDTGPRRGAKAEKTPEPEAKPSEAKPETATTPEAKPDGDESSGFGFFRFGKAA